MILLVDQLLECGALRFGDFTLTSGRKSRYYVDIKRASSRPEVLKEITRGFIEYGVDCDKVAGMELGAVALIVSYSLRTGKQFIIIRKGGREHGTKRKIEGEVLPGERILLLEDVVTSGGSVLEAIDRIEEAGGKVTSVLSVVDREEGGTEKVKERASFRSLVTAGELLKMAGDF
ncbi:MAG: orotate phosphoribosyltransferase [Candidatus Thermoplasmatota archaeon]|nr:orotate phosphoribosyltransferase [Candidatus Thermoplasmatota archaeon]